MIPDKFSRANFLAARDPSELADELGELLEGRLREAVDCAAAEACFVEDLAVLGHPLALFDQDGTSDDGSYVGSSWCDDWVNARQLEGNLILETLYPAATTVDGIPRPAGSRSGIEVTATFQRTKPR